MQHRVLRIDVAALLGRFLPRLGPPFGAASFYRRGSCRRLLLLQVQVGGIEVARLLQPVPVQNLERTPLQADEPCSPEFLKGPAHPLSQTFSKQGREQPSLSRVSPSPMNRA